MQERLHIIKWGAQHVASEPPRAPGYYKLQKNIQAHLEALKDSFEHYFPTAQEKVLDDLKWPLNVFSVNKKPPSLNSAQYEVLIHLTSHSELKIAFQNQSVTEFWLHLQDEFKILSGKAKLVLLPFSTTYLCEAGFSACIGTKTNTDVA